MTGNRHWDNAEDSSGPKHPRLSYAVRSEPDRTPHESPHPVSEEDYWAEFPDTLLTADVAKIIRTGVGAVRARLHAGTIPGYHLGGSWIMFKSEIRAWLASASNKPQPPSPAVDILADYPDELNHRDLAQLLRKSKQTVYAYLERGVIPGAFVGGRWVVHKWQVRDCLIEASNQPPATDPE